jgi:adenosylcobinamide-GDP ribazoletransferase
MRAADLTRLAPLVGAFLALGAAALLTRGLHLDGLSDTADGLAASYDRQRALAVMRRGDVGPAGVVTVVLVLGVQAAALAQVPAALAPAAALVGLTAGRLAVTLACVRGMPPARPDGLGAAVVGSVPVAPLVVVVAVVTALAGSATALAGAGLLPGALAVPVGLAAAAVLLARCRRRLGGVSGDVLGACVEVAAAAALVSLAATL